MTDVIHCEIVEDVINVNIQGDLTYLTLGEAGYMPTTRYDEDNDGIVDVAMKIGSTREEDIIKKDDIIDCGTF